MKTIPILNAIALASIVALVGCTHVHVSKATDGTLQFGATSLFSNNTLKGLGVDTTTKTTSNLLKITSNVNEPNAESITASGAALGDLLRHASPAGGLPTP